MIDRDTLNLLTAVLIGLCLLVQGTYTLTFHLMARWEESVTGRALMSKALALFALLFMVFIVFIPGKFPGEAWMRVVVSLGLLVTLTYQYVLMVKVQREVRSDERIEEKRVRDERAEAD